MNRVTRALAVAVTASATVIPIGAAPADAAPYCGIRWGSLSKQDSISTTTDGAMTKVRAGRHVCYDRLVVDGASWARVRYVDRVLQDGSGEVVPLRGGARLEIVTARADDVMTGEPTFTPADQDEIVDADGFRTFRQAAFAGSFEGQSTLGLGVRARLPFRVFVLEARGRASRVVIDVAHRW
jgi:hypothetical protein